MRQLILSHVVNRLQARRQDFQEGGSVRALPKAVNRGVKCRSVRVKRGKIFSRSFFSYLDELSYHFHRFALHYRCFWFACNQYRVTVSLTTWKGNVNVEFIFASQARRIAVWERDIPAPPKYMMSSHVEPAGVLAVALTHSTAIVSLAS